MDNNLINFSTLCRGIYFSKYYGGGGDGCWGKMKTEGVGKNEKKRKGEKGKGEKKT